MLGTACISSAERCGAQYPCREYKSPFGDPCVHIRIFATEEKGKMKQQALKTKNTRSLSMHTSVVISIFRCRELVPRHFDTALGVGWFLAARGKHFIQGFVANICHVESWPCSKHSHTEMPTPYAKRKSTARCSDAFVT